MHWNTRSLPIPMRQEIQASTMKYQWRTRNYILNPVWKWCNYTSIFLCADLISRRGRNRSLRSVSFCFDSHERSASGKEEERRDRIHDRHFWEGVIIIRYHVELVEERCAYLLSSQFLGSIHCMAENETEIQCEKSLADELKSKWGDHSCNSDWISYLNSMDPFPSFPFSTASNSFPPTNPKRGANLKE